MVKLYNIATGQALDPSTGEASEWSGVFSMSQAMDLVNYAFKNRQDIISVNGCSMRVEQLRAFLSEPLRDFQFSNELIHKAKKKWRT